MAYHPLLYKLLGIPDKGEEPTHYELLGLKPLQCTSGTIQERLVERKKRLRQSIPSRQFIPIVSLWEQDLDRAAGTLSDPQKRSAYDASLARHGRDPRHVLRRAEKAQQAREIIDSAVTTDGTMETTRRSAVVEQLHRLDIPRDLIESSLAEIPRLEPPSDDLLAEILPFFERAVDLHLNHGFLSDRDERALLRLAERLRISQEEAAKAIDDRLSARGARRIEFGRPAAQQTKARQGSTSPAGPAVARAEVAGDPPANQPQPHQNKDSQRASQPEPLPAREFLSHPDGGSREPLTAWPFVLAGAVAVAFLLVALALGTFEGCDVG